jgi:hypothetical protein
LVGLPVSQPTRFTGFGAKIYADLGAIKAVNLIALIAHNITQYAVIQLSAGPDINCAAYTTIIPWRSRTAFLYLANSQAYRFWSIQITDNGNLDAFIDIGRLMIGYATIMPRVARGWTRQMVHNNAGNIGEFGTEHIDRLYQSTKLVLPFKNFGSSEFETIRNMVHAAEGNLTPGFFIPDVTASDGYFGRFTSDPAETMDVYRSTSLEFVESSTGKRISEPQPLIFSAGGSYPTGTTFTRTGTANYVSGIGQIASAAQNVSRWDHRPNFGARALLLEIGTTNSHSAWTTYQSTIQAASITGPDGTVTGQKVIDNTVNDSHGAVQNTLITDNANVALSMCVKAAEYSWVYLQSKNKAGQSKWSWFNLAAGVWGTVQHGYARSHALGGGWYRLDVAFNNGTGAVQPYVAFAMVTGDGSVGNVGTGSAGIYISNTQIENNMPVATSYIAGSTTRNAEVLKMPFSLTPQQLTFYLKLIEGGSILINNAQIFNLGGDAAPLLNVCMSGGRYIMQHFNSSSSTGSGALPAAPTIGDLVELRGSLYTDGSVQLFQSINGQPEAYTSRSAVLAFAANWSTPYVYLNSQNASNYGINSFIAFKILRGIQPLSVCRTA